MTLPPERITIKRRREDEPVEALYIEQKRHCSTNTYWLRVSEEKSADQSNPLPPWGASLHSLKRSDGQEQLHAEAPDSENTEETTPANDVVLEQPRSPERVIRDAQRGAHRVLGEVRSETDSAQLVPPPPGKAMHDTKEPTTLKRTFHLSASSKCPKSQPGVSNGGVKRSRSHRHGLAVFEEKVRTAKASSFLKAEFQKDMDLSGQGSTVPGAVEGKRSSSRVWPAISTDREPPVATCLPGVLGGQGALSRSQTDDKIALCFSQAALRESRGNTISDIQPPSKIKFQPKSPKARREENLSVATGLSSEGLPDGPNLESLDDFVYDTYLRTKQPVPGFPLDGAMDIDQIERMTAGKVGVLIIAEEDEAIWETYAEEEAESDKDWNSEEEDENAEDFYGNDYPEDEMDSDDEYDRGAYQYRSRASDEEEFDADRNSWSHDEDETAYSWKLELGED